MPSDFPFKLYLAIFLCSFLLTSTSPAIRGERCRQASQLGLFDLEEDWRHDSGPVMEIAKLSIYDIQKGG